ncbi:hypothetical protein DP149_06430 [Clostridium tetani]|nr:hypothetical protein DP126_03600 [Clostridium tetani]RXI63021.1 hypothetical protein DP132_05240 [Clostridium tetani]RXI63543.1 hypothetical protein DP125_01930 [Clostridium tetani]RXI66418.1 hypothetical protein DP123_01235 [Clostridium tetani]RXI72449.1 hypothetical protein DP121_00720 [Clostridium tetani]
MFTPRDLGSIELCFVSQTEILPSTSFRFHLAVDTLAHQLVVPTTSHNGLSPSSCCPCWAH